MEHGLFLFLPRTNHGRDERANAQGETPTPLINPSSMLRCPSIPR